jgi:hypothetical protein
VRTAARNVADRARGLPATSASDGRTARAGRSKLGARAVGANGKWRDPDGPLPDLSRRKVLTRRSSAE